MEPQIFRTPTMQRQQRGNRIASVPLASREAGSSQLLTGLTEIPPSGVIPLHTHSSEEFILVLQGRATVRVGDDEHSVAAMDATLIPQDVEHQFLNVGEDQLVILWVYGDPDSTRTLVESGVTLGHLAPYPTDD